MPRATRALPSCWPRSSEKRCQRLVNDRRSQDTSLFREPSMRMQPILAALALLSAGIRLGVSSSPASTDAATVAPIVRTRAFELVDQDGTVRAALTVEANGEAV